MYTTLSTVLLQKNSFLGTKEQKRLDRQRAIREYIAKMRVTTENKIVLHIKNLGKNLGTRNTVRKELGIMKQKGMIKIDSSGKLGQAHKISINHDNDLNYINSGLERFDKIITQMEKPARRIVNRRYRQDGDVLEELGFGIYSIRTFIGLGILLKEVISLPYPADSHILHGKILELLQRLVLLTMQSDNVRDEKEHLKSIFGDMDKMIKALSRP